jgi:hypothetical protein
LSFSVKLQSRYGLRGIYGTTEETAEKLVLAQEA